MQWRRRKTSGAGDEEEGECDPEETKWRIGERRKAHRWKWNIGGEETDRGDTFCGANQKKDIDPSSPAKTKKQHIIVLETLKFILGLQFPSIN